MHLLFLQGNTPDILSAARQALVDWSHRKIHFFSDAPALHAAHVPSTIPGSCSRSAFGAPFILEGLFGEADAEAMVADPDSEPATDDAGMDIENDAAAVAADGGMTTATAPAHCACYNSPSSPL
jgi:nuclear GTP-binding protein